MNKTECFVSVVLPIYNQGKLLKKFLSELAPELESHYSHYEILLVDNHSTDNTIEVMDSIIKEVPYIRFLGLNDKCDFEILCAAGLENVIGDIIVLMDIRFDQISIVHTAISETLAGKEIIIGIDPGKKSFAYRVLSRIFHLVFAKLIHYRIPSDATLFRVMSRRALNAVLNRTRYLNHLFSDISQTEYPIETLTYSQVERDDAFSTKTALIGINKLLSILVFNSTALLRMVNLLGIFGSLLGVLISCYSLLIHFVKADVIEGWTTLTFFMSVQFSLLFIVLFFYGEYMARMIDEHKEGHEYTVQFEKHSSVMTDESYHNVTGDPLKSSLNSIQTGRDR